VIPLVGLCASRRRPGESHCRCATSSPRPTNVGS